MGCINASIQGALLFEVEDLKGFSILKSDTCMKECLSH